VTLLRIHDRGISVILAAKPWFRNVAAGMTGGVGFLAR